MDLWYWRMLLEVNVINQKWVLSSIQFTYSTKIWFCQLWHLLTQRNTLEWKDWQWLKIIKIQLLYLVPCHTTYVSACRNLTFKVPQQVHRRSWWFRIGQNDFRNHFFFLLKLSHWIYWPCWWGRGWYLWYGISILVQFGGRFRLRYNLPRPEVHVFQQLYPNYHGVGCN